MLEDAETLHAFLNLIGSHKFHKYNFNSVNTYGTVEFRQADAAIDMDKAVKWINLIVQFVQTAIKTENGDFEAWAACEDPSISCPRHIFKKFGVPWAGQTEQYQARMWLDKEFGDGPYQWGTEEGYSQELEADDLWEVESPNEIIPKEVGQRLPQSGPTRSRSHSKTVWEWGLISMLFFFSFFDIISYALE
jgi:hypothetical protein